MPAAGARGLLLVPTALEAPLPRDRLWVLRPENYLEGFLLGRVSPKVAAQIAGTDPSALRQRADGPGPAGPRCPAKSHGGRRWCSMPGDRERTCSAGCPVARAHCGTRS